MTEQQTETAAGWIYVVGLPQAAAHAQAQLLELGWNVRTFATATDCVIGLSRRVPEAMLLDTAVHDIPAAQFVARLRQIGAELSRMKVFAYCPPEASSRWAEGVFDGVFPKPGRAEDFAEWLPAPQRGSPGLSGIRA